MYRIYEHIRVYLGTMNMPLSYVVQREEELPPSGDDPENIYVVIQDEMLHCETIAYPNQANQHTQYFFYSRKIWYLLERILHGKY